MANQTPSRRPADESTLPGVIKIAVNKELQNMNVMMPVEVVAYDRSTNRATVKHLLQMVGSDGELVDRANVASVRVMQPGNGAFNISLPIQPGDKGWILAADRDISTFQQDLQKSPPNTARMHSFQDGLFMPDAMSNGAPPAGQEGRVVIGANSGSAFLAFDGDSFELNAGGNVLTFGADGLKMNGINIGDTHTHGGVTTGTDSTDEPNA